LKSGIKERERIIPSLKRVSFKSGIKEREIFPSSKRERNKSGIKSDLPSSSREKGVNPELKR